MTQTAPATPTRGWDELLAEAVRVLSEAARLQRPVGPPEDTSEERIDLAEFVSLALAATAANIGGIEEVLAGRPGSWEAGNVRDLLKSTVGWDEEQLWRHRTEPVVIDVHVDHILAELGVHDLYDESAGEIWRLQAALGDEDSERAEMEYDRLARLSTSTKINEAR